MDSEQKDINTIISGCKIGDRKAQESLYRNFYKGMMTLCLRYTKNEEDALEALNTGFYKVYKNIVSYDARKATLYTWIRTIIIHCCLDLIRNKGGRKEWKRLDEAVDVELPPNVFAMMSADEILRLVRELPPATQGVFNLYVMDGFSHKEIGKLMNISEGTSKWHLSEARKILQQLIQNKEKGS